MRQGGADWSVHGPAVLGCLAILLLASVALFWGNRTEIVGAVIAPGTVVVQSSSHLVQHEEGGRVRDVLVRDGEYVEAGEVLIRLEPDTLVAELDVVEGQLVEIAVRQARLEAEQADLGDMPVSNRVLRLVHASQDGEEQLLGQRALFNARRLTLAQQLAQISERIRQSGERISGAEAQLASLVGQAELVSRELGDQELLLKKGLVQRGSVISLQRQQLQLAGDIGRLRSEIAQQRSEIAAFKLEALRLEAERREEAIVVLRDLSIREMELLQQRRDIRHRLDRMRIKAPVSGVVHGATIDNPGAVIKRAETLMFIVPQDQPLRVSARVAATDVDQISVGQPASLKFSAFSMRSTPEITGETLSISPDAFTEDATGQRYYAVEISADLDSRAQSRGIRLVPGMPVDAFFETAPRTPISFLIQPLTEYLGRALREG